MSLERLELWESTGSSGGALAALGEPWELWESSGSVQGNLSHVNGCFLCRGLMHRKNATSDHVEAMSTRMELANTAVPSGRAFLSLVSSGFGFEGSTPTLSVQG